MRHGWARRDRKGTTNLPLSLDRQGYWGQALPRGTWPAGGRGRAPNSDALSLKACVAHSSKPTFCPILVFDSHHPGFLLKSLPRSVLPVRSQKDQSHTVQGARLKPRCARLFQTVHSAAPRPLVQDQSLLPANLPDSAPSGSRPMGVPPAPGSPTLP